MNQLIMQKLALFIMRTTLRQCENLTKDVLQRHLEINDDDINKLIELLKQEHVIREKFTFACPVCGELNTIQVGAIRECEICSAPIDVVSLLGGATIRYVLDRDDFFEFMNENYKAELDAARRGEIPVPKVIKFSSVNISEEEKMSEQKKEPRLFISHSTKDTKYVKAFVEFLEALGMPERSIFCSSVDGYKIAWGTGIYDYLASEFTNNDKELMVLFMLSSNYYESVACLNEMGATWILKKDYRSILLPGFKYEKIEGAIDAELIGIAMDSSSLTIELNDIKNQFAEIFGFQPPIDAKWDRIRSNFIEAIERVKQEIKLEEAKIEKETGND